MGAAAAASTVPFVSLGFPAPASAAISSVSPLYKVIVDRRLVESVAFGDAAGLPLAHMTGDITDIWYDDLFHHWRDVGPADAVAIAGITTHGPIFCLERLALEHGLRVVCRGDHEAGADGVIRHEFRGLNLPLPDPPPFHGRGSKSPLPLAGEGWVGVPPSLDWVAFVAKLMLRSAPSTSMVRTTNPADFVAATPGDLAEPLVSWLIAPVAGASA